MDIQTTKLELMRLLLNTHKEQVLTQIKEVFEQQDELLFDELNEAEKSAIEEGLKQVEQGKVKPHDEVMAKFRQKYSQ